MGINMNPFLLPEKERLLSWRELRNQITNQQESDKYETLLRWWAKAPICAYSIDASDCSQWPTPWELLNENMFCTSAVAFMMAHTLALAGFDRDRMRLAFIRGNDDERLVLVIDNQFVLNYSYAEVFAWEEVRAQTDVRQLYMFVGDKLVEA